MNYNEIAEKINDMVGDNYNVIYSTNAEDFEQMITKNVGVLISNPKNYDMNDIEGLASIGTFKLSFLFSSEREELIDSENFIESILFNNLHNKIFSDSLGNRYSILVQDKYENPRVDIDGETYSNIVWTCQVNDFGSYIDGKDSKVFINDLEFKSAFNVNFSVRRNMQASTENQTVEQIPISLEYLLVLDYTPILNDNVHNLLRDSKHILAPQFNVKYYDFFDGENNHLDFEGIMTVSDLTQNSTTGTNQTARVTFSSIKAV